jgi:hypothetical protein
VNERGSPTGRWGNELHPLSEKELERESEMGERVSTRLVPVATNRESRWGFIVRPVPIINPALPLPAL